MSSSPVSFNKIFKLEKPQDTIQWPHRVKATISPEDTGLLSLKAKPGGETVNHALCIAAIAKSKSKFTLCSGDSALCKARTLVDCDGKALAFVKRSRTHI